MQKQFLMYALVIPKLSTLIVNKHRFVVHVIMKLHEIKNSISVNFIDYRQNTVNNVLQTEIF